MRQSLTADGDASHQVPQERCDAPIFVLTTSRSGSTLLRFILDSHPDIACPPETSVAFAAAQLARTWDIVENAGSDATPLTEPRALPPHAAAAVRDAIDQVFGRYLQRQGKRRWCDKSLDSFQVADLLIQLYPQARFVCLYRHCLDVIASGVEMCPWGLTRNGFDSFVAQHPGNSVAAIGSYWVSTVSAIMAFEAEHQDRCHRIRYEDLVTAPEATAAAMFSFLGVDHVPGITESCFRAPHEANGPGDEKIWFTSNVTSASMGRGVRVPVGALAPSTRESVNQALGKLGYRQIDDTLAALGPIDLRADPISAPAAANGHGSSGHQEVAAAVSAIEARLASQPDHARAEIARRWPTVAGETVALVVLAPGGENRDLRCCFSPADGDGQSASATVRAADRGEPVATILASPAVWLSLLDGSANVVTEMCQSRLCCVNKRDAFRLRSDEMHATAALLGLTQIPVART